MAAPSHDYAPYVPSPIYEQQRCAERPAPSSSRVAQWGNVLNQRAGLNVGVASNMQPPSSVLLVVVASQQCALTAVASQQCLLSVEFHQGKWGHRGVASFP